ncbi:MAG: ATP-binding protein [Candidatus Hydrogenedentes bacterium]|nr:ATP-binding protein [Candidatus Hydrogenedentota bacterium]
MAPTQLRTAPAPAIHKRLGDLLLEGRVITPEQLDVAIRLQKERGGFLGQVLVQEGFVTQNQVASCLVKQCKIPHLSLMDYDISNEVLLLIPEEVCLKYRLLPIDKLGRILTVAMVDPLDLDALEQVRRLCPELRIKPILCNWEHFQLVSQKIFGQGKSSEGQQVMTASSLGLREPAAKTAAPPRPAAAQPVEAHHGASDAMDVALQDALSAMAQQQQPARPAAPSFSVEAMTVAMRETLREALDANQRHQREQESKLSEIAEAILHNVQQSRHLVETSVVQEGVRRDLSSAAPNRHASVVPFQSWKGGKIPAAEAVESREEDARAMEALYSEQPLETLTFANFFPGAANAFTYSLGQAVAEHPGRDYNPFFLYGHVGIGKTHLISAIGNAILEKHPAQRVGYVSASHFSRRVQEAAREGALELFRENYFHWDVLILDDIQFLGGRVEAQEECFHIFNMLYQQGRQIIIASDKAPDRLGLLEQRLISRFDSGIVAELKAPEWETRMQILRHHLETNAGALRISDEVLSLIAMRVSNDVRKMTGAFRKVTAYAKLVGQEISLEMAAEIIKHLHLQDEPA